MKHSHLTEEAFLALSGNRLSGENLRAAQSHLSVCTACQKEYARFRFAHSVVERMAQIGYKEALGTSAFAPAIRRKNEFAFPWKPVLAVVTGCVILVIILFAPRAIPTANAEELLSRAVLIEASNSGQKGFRIEVGGRSCAGGHRGEEVISFQKSIACNRALQELQKSPWGSGDPLSAKTYVNWRKTLHHHSDRVSRQKASWKVETITEEGNLHSASLELDGNDYHALKLTLDFASDDEISIGEALEPLPLTAPVIAAEDTRRVPKQVDNPHDVLEVHAWTSLRKLHADSGWEALVVRNDDDEVRVKAVVKDQSRAKEFEDAFADAPGVTLDVRPNTSPGDVRGLFPERLSPVEDAPPLATDWLRNRFSDSDEGVAYSNQVLHRSQEILGRAFLLDQLRRRQLSLARCTCVREMNSLIHLEGLDLKRIVSGLRTELEPLVGANGGSFSEPLSFADARALDASLHELLWRRPLHGSATFDASIQQVRSLLAKN
jgi:hypothetical protein